MKTAILHNLPFRVPSPSHYQHTTLPVDVMLASDRTWRILLEGEDSLRDFPSRDAAIACIADGLAAYDMLRRG